MEDSFQSLGSAAAGVVGDLAARLDQKLLPAGVEKFAVIDRASWLARRKADVTASVAAALFGQVHPYMTPYELWALKSGLIEGETEETPAMRRGRLLEPVALDLLREERPDWLIKAGRDYYRHPGHRLGATPDSLCRRPDIEGLGTVQIKTVGKFAFEKGWKNEFGEVEPPLWVGVQAATEAFLTGASWACIVAMALGDGGLDFHLVDVPINRKLIDKLISLTQEFWARVADNRPYEPDYGKDAALIARIYSRDDGGEIDLSGNNRVVDLLATRRVLKDSEAAGSTAAKERKLIDAELIHILGNASRGLLADGTMIEAKTISRKAYEVKASSYRQVNVKEAAA